MNSSQSTDSHQTPDSLEIKLSPQDQTTFHTLIRLLKAELSRQRILKRTTVDLSPGHAIDIEKQSKINLAALKERLSEAALLPIAERTELFSQREEKQILTPQEKVLFRVLLSKKHRLQHTTYTSVVEMVLNKEENEQCLIDPQEMRRMGLSTAAIATPEFGGAEHNIYFSYGGLHNSLPAFTRNRTNPSTSKMEDYTTLQIDLVKLMQKDAVIAKSLWCGPHFSHYQQAIVANTFSLTPMSLDKTQFNWSFELEGSDDKDLPYLPVKLLSFKREDGSEIKLKLRMKDEIALGKDFLNFYAYSFVERLRYVGGSLRQKLLAQPDDCYLIDVLTERLFRVDDFELHVPSKVLLDRAYTRVITPQERKRVTTQVLDALKNKEAKAIAEFKKDDIPLDGYMYQDAFIFDETPAPGYPLLEAIRNQDLDMIRALLENGANRSLFEEFFESSWDSLLDFRDVVHELCVTANVALYQLLKGYGFDINRYQNSEIVLQIKSLGEGNRPWISLDPILIGIMTGTREAKSLGLFMEIAKDFYAFQEDKFVGKDIYGAILGYGDNRVYQYFMQNKRDRLKDEELDENNFEKLLYVGRVIDDFPDMKRLHLHKFFMKETEVTSSNEVEEKQRSQIAHGYYLFCQLVELQVEELPSKFLKMNNVAIENTNLSWLIREGYIDPAKVDHDKFSRALFNKANLSVKRVEEMIIWARAALNYDISRPFNYVGSHLTTLVNSLVTHGYYSQAQRLIEEFGAQLNVSLPEEKENREGLKTDDDQLFYECLKDDNIQDRRVTFTYRDRGRDTFLEAVVGANPMVAALLQKNPEFRDYLYGKGCRLPSHYLLFQFLAHNKKLDELKWLFEQGSTLNMTAYERLLLSFTLLTRSTPEIISLFEKQGFVITASPVELKGKSKSQYIKWAKLVLDRCESDHVVEWMESDYFYQKAKEWRTSDWYTPSESSIFDALRTAARTFYNRKYALTSVLLYRDALLASNVEILDYLFLHYRFEPEVFEDFLYKVAKSPCWAINKAITLKWLLAHGVNGLRVSKENKGLADILIKCDGAQACEPLFMILNEYNIPCQASYSKIGTAELNKLITPKLGMTMMALNSKLNYKLIRELVYKGAKLNQAAPYTTDRNASFLFVNFVAYPLELACQAGEVGLVKFLLQHGAKPDLCASKEFTKGNNLQRIIDLYQQAKLLSKSEDQLKALVEIMSCLIKYGANTEDLIFDASLGELNSLLALKADGIVELMEAKEEKDEIQVQRVSQKKNALLEIKAHNSSEFMAALPKALEDKDLSSNEIYSFLLKLENTKGAYGFLHTNKGYALASIFGCSKSKTHFMDARKLLVTAYYAKEAEEKVAEEDDIAFGRELENMELLGSQSFRY